MLFPEQLLDEIYGIQGDFIKTQTFLAISTDILGNQQNLTLMQNQGINLEIEKNY